MQEYRLIGISSIIAFIPQGKEIQNALVIHSVTLYYILFQILERVLDWCAFEIPQLKSISDNKKNIYMIKEILLGQRQVLVRIVQYFYAFNSEYGFVNIKVSIVVKGQPLIKKETKISLDILQSENGFFQYREIKYWWIGVFCSLSKMEYFSFGIFNYKTKVLEDGKEYAKTVE